MPKLTREQLITHCVHGLQDFGYSAVNQENIFTDFVYSQFFIRMLKNGLGEGYDDLIQSLIQEVEEKQSKTL
ncbi:hypothetical protein ACFYKX_10695 [Cytobacillus sp. FJAT-54145]|uniref:Uncharacterized protein n=1 Tax=Cytobacillus spartinae TaxID=3299023 RepID=A0ABW6KBV6_9BACI